MAATPRKGVRERKAAPRRTVRGRLVILVAASVGAATVGVTGVSAWRETGRETALQAEHLRAAATVMSPTTADALALHDRARAARALHAIAAFPGVTSARIEQSNGTTLAQVGVVERAGAAGAAYAPILYNGRQVGRLVLVGAATSVAKRFEESLGASLVAALLALGVGFAVAWRMQQAITTPIAAVTRSMARIEAGYDPDIDVKTQAPDAELGELVQGFNRMLGEMRARDASLAERMAALQGQVVASASELRLAQGAAESANRSKFDALASIGHEIDRPLSGVAAMAEILAVGELPLRQRRLAEAIAMSGSSLLATIRDVRDVADIAAGKLELKLAQVDLAEVVEDVCALFSAPAAAKGLDLAAYVDPTIPARIAADPVRLRQVISALVNNAVTFTEAGGVLIEVEPEGEGAFRISVHDTGVGIPKDKLGEVFGALTQGDLSSVRKLGTGGLGLAVCRRVVEAMGGRFLVNSTVGRGTSFIFRLPAQVLAPASPWPMAPKANGRAQLAVQGMSSRRALSRYLAQAGFAMASAPGVGAGLRIGDAISLARLEPDGTPSIGLAGLGESAPYEMLRAGRVQALLAQPFRRQDLAVLLQQLQRGEALSDPQIALAIDTAEQQPQFAGARVLVADPSPLNREVAREALLRLGAEPKLVHDAAQVVEVACSEAFDLILLDDSLRAPDGAPVARHIRRRESRLDRSPTPVVGVGPLVAGDTTWRDAGLDAVLHRPFGPAELATMLGTFLTPTPRAPARVPAVPAMLALESVPAGEAGLIDAKVAAQLEAIAAGGRSEFVSRVYSLYRENAPDSVLKLMDAAAHSDTPACAKAAHALKSMSFNIGASAVAALAGDIELAAREGDTPSPTTIAELQNLLAATLGRLNGGLDAVVRPDHALSIPGADAELLADMERGLVEDQMSLVYQPQVDRDGEQVIGVEALIRWTHPTRGPISPGVFIPIAERYGLIPRITDWVVERMLAETRYLTGLQVAFNVSAIEFSEPAFVDRLLALIGRHGYDTRRLEVEITETAILQNETAVRSNIDRLREAGMKVALDDFGAGYSSLGHLRRYPFDKLKIDREFITDCSRDMQAATVVHAVVSIGRALGMKVIAEGVETDTQRKFLKVAGVHAMQGYLFGKPVSIDELAFSLSRKSRLERA